MIFEDDESDFAKGFNEWWENLSEEDKAELDRQEKENRSITIKHPLYKKSYEIPEIVEAIIESLPEEEQHMHRPITVA